MRYCVDIDGTICTLTPDPKTYEDAEPWNDRIETINKLYDCLLYTSDAADE